jgi:hypothetical protein
MPDTVLNFNFLQSVYLYSQHNKFDIQFVSVFGIYISAEFHTSCSNGKLVISIKPIKNVVRFRGQPFFCFTFYCELVTLLLISKIIRAIDLSFEV